MMYSSGAFGVFLACAVLIGQLLYPSFVELLMRFGCSFKKYCLGKIQFCSLIRQQKRLQLVSFLLEIIGQMCRIGAVRCMSGFFRTTVEALSMKS